MNAGDPLDPKLVDALYGLEPVFEPGGEAAGGLDEFASVNCPYCGEPFQAAIDLSAGSFRYVEDCQVCCQPIDFIGTVDDDGSLGGLTVERLG